MGQAAVWPLIDRRFYKGAAIIIATQAAVWFGFGVILMGTGGTIWEFFEAFIFSLLVALPLACVGFILAIGPAVALWMSLLAIFRHFRFRQRSSVLIAAPIVALMGSIVCLLGIFTKSQRVFETEFLYFALLFSIPGVVVAEIYAFLAWPSTKTSEGGQI